MSKPSLPSGKITFAKPVKTRVAVCRLLGYVLLILGAATFFGLTSELLDGKQMKLNAIVFSLLFTVAMLYLGYCLVTAMPGWKVILTPEGSDNGTEHFLPSDQYVALRKTRGGLAETDESLIQRQKQAIGMHRIAAGSIMVAFFVIMVSGGFNVDKTTVVITIEDYQEAYRYTGLEEDDYALQRVSGSARLVMTEGDKQLLSREINAADLEHPAIRLQTAQQGTQATLTFTENPAEGDDVTYDWFIATDKDSYDRMITGKAVQQPTEESFKKALRKQHEDSVITMAYVLGVQPSQVELMDYSFPLPHITGNFVEKPDGSFDLSLIISYSGESRWRFEVLSEALQKKQ